MTDVLLTHSYHLPFDRKQVRKMQPYPPLGTLYAAALLRQRGLSVALFDTMLADPSGFTEALKLHNPKIVAVYEDDFNFLSKMCLTRMREIAFEMAAQTRAYGARVVAHGSDATDHTADFLNAGFEHVLIGEAEHTLLELSAAMLGGNDEYEVPGIVFREKSTGRIVKSRTRAALHYDAPLPNPARDLVDHQLYRDAWVKAHGRFSMNAISSRGCPFQCNWCAKPIFGDNYRLNSAADVAAEMRSLRDDYGADHIWFADDIFALNRHWIQDFADEVNRLGARLPFKIQARADLMTPETAQALADSGCEEVWMGVESGSQRILDAMEKGLRVEEVTRARRYLGEAGIKACFFLQFGYPGETWSDIQSTVALVRETKPDDIGVSLSYPLPNTRFHERVREQLGAKQNWADSDDLCVMFKGAYVDDFYRLIRDALHLEVNGWTHSDNSAQLEAQQLWQVIRDLEPSSHNQQPTALPQLRTRSELFIPVQQLSMGVGD